MQEIYGDFVEPGDGQEYLVIRFSPTAIPLKLRWRNNGLSADFLAEYWATFFPAYDIASQQRQLEIKGAINYVANELLENVMKFSYSPSTYAVDLGLYLFADEFRFYASNPMSPDALAAFKARIQQLLEENPLDLYMQQVEANAMGGSGQASQLGLLTMLTDYDAELAWKIDIQDADAEYKIPVVTTMVRLKF